MSFIRAWPRESKPSATFVADSSNTCIYFNKESRNTECWLCLDRQYWILFDVLYIATEIDTIDGDVIMSLSRYILLRFKILSSGIKILFVRFAGYQIQYISCVATFWRLLEKNLPLSSACLWDTLVNITSENWKTIPRTPDFFHNSENVLKFLSIITVLVKISASLQE